MADNRESDIVHRELETEGVEPAVQVAEVVADLEGRNPEDLTSTYDCIDHVLDHVFTNPPSPEAQVEITFSYEGYRITVDQSGDAKFVES